MEIQRGSRENGIPKKTYGLLVWMLRGEYSVLGLTVLSFIKLFTWIFPPPINTIIISIIDCIFRRTSDPVIISLSSHGHCPS